MNTFVLIHDQLIDPTYEDNPECYIEVEIPEGYYRAFRGVILPGDLFLNIIEVKKGIVSWEPLIASEGHPTVEFVSCVIRKGSTVDKECPRCRNKPVLVGFKYCRWCCNSIKTQHEN